MSRRTAAQEMVPNFFSHLGSNLQALEHLCQEDRVTDVVGPEDSSRRCSRPTDVAPALDACRGCVILQARMHVIQGGSRGVISKQEMMGTQNNHSMCNICFIIDTQ